MTKTCVTLEKYDATSIDLPNAAKLIAEEIRLHGHYQSKPLSSAAVGYDTRACLVANCVFPYLPAEIKQQLAAEIADRAKHTAAFPQHGYVSTPHQSMIIWNDNAPTEQVLEVLDAIAAPVLVADRD